MLAAHVDDLADRELRGRAGDRRVVDQLGALDHADEAVHNVLRREVLAPRLVRRRDVLQDQRGDGEVLLVRRLAAGRRHRLQPHKRLPAYSPTGLSLSSSEPAGDEAAARAEAAGVKVVMNRCPKIEYGRLSGEIGWTGVNSGQISSKRPVLRSGFQHRGLPGTRQKG